MNDNFKPTIQPTSKIPFFRRAVLQNFPFIEKDFDALTDYELLCKVVEYLNKVIDQTNLMEDNENELVRVYNELYNYVKNYFDNLDVQEEINNKLDEMAESGELTDIIAQYLGLAGLITFNNVSEMKLAENLVNGSKCKTLGYYSVNDGGASYYKIRNITNEDVVDEKIIIALYNENLIAQLIIEDEMTIEQLGAKGDGTSNDSDSFLTAIENEINIILFNKTYFINDITASNKNFNIKGNNSIITNGHFIFNNCNVKIEGIKFYNTLTKALYFNSGKLYINDCKFDNITIQENTSLSSHGAIYLANNINAIIENCNFSNIKSYGAIYTYGYGYINANNNYFNNCDYRAFNIIKNTNYDIALRGYIKNNYIVNCGANNTTGSAVGCNGIYAKACNLIIDNNFIKDSRENAIEIESDYYNMISNNVIDGTNVEIETKSTPSVEGIFIHSNADIVNNRITNARRRSISSPKTSSANDYNLNIDNNTIVNMVEYDSHTDAIYIIGSSTSNKKITNNNTTYDVVCTNSSENTIYNGDIKLLRDSSTKFNKVIPLNKSLNFYNYFSNTDNYNGFKLQNITSSSIVTISDTSIKALSYSYEQYNRIESPKFVPKGKFMISVKVKFIGTIQARLMKNGSQLSTLISTTSSQILKEIESIYNFYTSDDVSEYCIYINCPTSGETLTISDIDIQIIN